MADSPNNTVGSVHVPGPIGAIRNQTPSQVSKQQQPKWLKQHQPSRKPSGGTR